MYGYVAQMRQIEQMISQAHITAMMGENLKGVVKVMDKCNENMKVQDIIKMITDFEKAGMKMEMKSEAMSDAMAGVGGNVDEEADNIYN